MKKLLAWTIVLVTVGPIMVLVGFSLGMMVINITWLELLVSVGALAVVLLVGTALQWAAKTLRNG
jgi:hypothetical protein